MLYIAHILLLQPYSFVLILHLLICSLGLAHLEILIYYYIVIFIFKNSFCFVFLYLFIYFLLLFCRRTVPNIPPRIPDRPVMGQGGRWSQKHSKVVQNYSVLELLLIICDWFQEQALRTLLLLLLLLLYFRINIFCRVIGTKIFLKNVTAFFAKSNYMCPMHTKRL